MVDLFVARLPDECKYRLQAAEARAESSLRKKIRAYFESRTPEDVVASKDQDAVDLIPHFEEYSEAVLGAYAEELIPTKPELHEYLEELRDCAARFPDYILPERSITQDDIDFMIRNPGFTPGWAPSGYWEETFLDSWNRLVSTGHLPPTADISHAFDWVFRWAFRPSQNAWTFRKRLTAQLEISIEQRWKMEWLERRVTQGADAKTGVNSVRRHDLDKQVNLSRIEQEVYDTVGEDNFRNLSNPQIWASFRQALKRKELRERFGSTPGLNEALRSCLNRIRRKKVLRASSEIEKERSRTR